MIAYKVLSLVSCLMTFSLGSLIGELLNKKFGKASDVKFLKYARITFLVLSFCVLIWLLFNRELFHWKFDIATGEPVDHYSTYGRCIAYVIVSLASNVVSYIILKSRKI